jgi:hypothetical protein
MHYLLLGEAVPLWMRDTIIHWQYRGTRRSNQAPVMGVARIPPEGAEGSSRFGYKRTFKLFKNVFADFAEELIKRSYRKYKIYTCF